jgi:hypothetical protein
VTPWTGILSLAAKLDGSVENPPMFRGVGNTEFWELVFYLHAPVPARNEVKVEVTIRLTVSQSVSMSWYRAPLWNLRPVLLPAWKLLSWLFGTPSLTRGRVCNFQCIYSKVRVAQNPWAYFTVSSETPPPWWARFPQEQGDPVVPPGTGFPFLASYYGGGILSRLHTGSSATKRLLTVWGRALCVFGFLPCAQASVSSEQNPTWLCW